MGDGIKEAYNQRPWQAIYGDGIFLFWVIKQYGDGERPITQAFFLLVFRLINSYAGDKFCYVVTSSPNLEEG